MPTTALDPRVHRALDDCAEYVRLRGWRRIDGTHMGAARNIHGVIDVVVPIGLKLSVVCALAAYLGLGGLPYAALDAWNHADGRTAADVEAAFRGAAKAPIFIDDETTDSPSPDNKE